MVIAVKAQDLLDGHADIVGDAVQGPVLAINEAPARHLAFQEPLERLPVRVARKVEQDDRRGLRLACLKQGEQLEALVERPETSRQDREGSRLLHQHELSREEVLHLDEPALGGELRMRGGLEGETDLDAEGHVGAGPVGPRSHDARPGAGDHEPLLMGHASGEVGGLGIERVGDRCARGAEHGQLRDAPIVGEQLERPLHLGER